MRFLITGGSGYFGGELKRALLQEGHHCVNIDLAEDADTHLHLVSIKGSVTDAALLETIFTKQGPFDGIFHAAAQLQLTRKTRPLFYATNVDSTQLLAEQAVQQGVKQFVFISSNCVYGKINGLNIPEETPLHPFEVYGQTKVASETLLQRFKDKMNVIIFRPPTIIGEGRLGILSIVFDFIREGRKIGLVGDGENRYQFVYSNDFIHACKEAVRYEKSGIFNIGCDNIPTLNQLFQTLIDQVGSSSRLYHLLPSLAVPVMKLCFKWGISPLGPYQYNMIMNTYSGDTTRLRKELNWSPTKSNVDMLLDNYRYYDTHYEQIHARHNQLSGHRKAGQGGILKLMKWMS